VSITYMAAAYVFIKGGHLAVEVVIGRAGPRWGKGLNLLRAIVALAFCVMITWYGLMLAINSFRLDIHSSGNLHVPVAPVQILVAIGMGILSLVILAYLIEAIKSSATSEKRIAQSDSAKGGQQ